MKLKKKYKISECCGKDDCLEVEKALKEQAKEIFEDIDNQLEEETGKKIIRFKDIRKKYT